MVEEASFDDEIHQDEKERESRENRSDLTSRTGAIVSPCDLHTRPRCATCPERPIPLSRRTRDRDRRCVPHQAEETGEGHIEAGDESDPTATTLCATSEPEEVPKRRIDNQFGVAVVWVVKAIKQRLTNDCTALTGPFPASCCPRQR